MPKPIPPSPPTHHRYTFPKHGDPHVVSLQWETKRIKPLVLPPTAFRDLVRWDLPRIIPRMDPSNSIIPADSYSPDSKIVSKHSNKTVQTKLLFDGVGVGVPLGFTAAALPVAIFVGLLPITCGGMGTRDSAIAVLFAEFATAPQALAVALLYSFFGYWLLAVVGIPFVKKAIDW